jgi:hypothetical protein
MDFKHQVERALPPSCLRQNCLLASSLHLYLHAWYPVHVEMQSECSALSFRQSRLCRVLQEGSFDHSAKRWKAVEEKKDPGLHTRVKDEHPTFYHSTTTMQAQWAMVRSRTNTRTPSEVWANTALGDWDTGTYCTGVLQYTTSTWVLEYYNR